jgi:hypothetical protein
MILQQLGAKQDRLELEGGRRPSASGWPAGREPRRLARATHLGQGGWELAGVRRRIGGGDKRPSGSSWGGSASGHEPDDYELPMHACQPCRVSKCDATRTEAKVTEEWA